MEVAIPIRHQSRSLSITAAIVFSLLSSLALSQGNNSESSISSRYPSFTKSSQVFEPAWTRHILLEDFDGDGDLDAVLANCKLFDSRILLNNGKGEFIVTEQRLSQQAHGIDAGDLDGDGDLDILITCHYYVENNVPYNLPSRVYLNDGKGVFSEHQEFGDSLWSGNEVYLIDIDGDDDLDALVQYYNEPNRIYFNDGKANFSNSNLSYPEEGPVFGDLNNDGHTDLFVGLFGSGYEVWFGDGRGAFTKSWQFADSTTRYTPISLADLDCDGDLDAVVVNFDVSRGYPTKTWYNDGTGKFACSKDELPGVFRSVLTLGDLDNDGFPDAVAPNHDNQVYVWFNNGTGKLIDTGLRLGNKSDKNESAALGDIDNDGDLDIFVAEGRGGENSLWINGLINKAD